MNEQDDALFSALSRTVDVVNARLFLFVCVDMTMFPSLVVDVSWID